MSTDCRRLGLRCIDCLPRVRWCDLCADSHLCPHGADLRWARCDECPTPPTKDGAQ